METMLCSYLHQKWLQQLLHPHLRASGRLKSLPGTEKQPGFVVDTQAWTKPISPSHLITHSELLAAELRIHMGTHTSVCVSAGKSLCHVGAPFPVRTTRWTWSRHGQGQHSHSRLCGCNSSHLTRQLRDSREEKQPSSSPWNTTICQEQVSGFNCLN